MYTVIAAGGAAGANGGAIGGTAVVGYSTAGGAVKVNCGAAGKSSEVFGHATGKSSNGQIGIAAGRSNRKSTAAGGIAVCLGSSTVQASGDDSRSSVELGLSINR